MLKQWPTFKFLEVEEVYQKLNQKDKQELEEYLKYRQARGLSSERKLADTRRRILQLIHILGKDYAVLDLKKLRELIIIINESDLKSTTKNDIKVDLKNFLKFKFKDWSERFNSLEDCRTLSDRREERINSKTILRKEDVEKLVRHETLNYWKAFTLVQYEAGLRTQEVRLLKWSDVKFDVDGDLSEVNIFSNKTKRARPVFVKDATFFLKKLKEQQENTNNKGVYVFHSKTDVNKPIDKSTVNMWFIRLSERALGRKCWPYLLRHSRASELYELARQNKISRDVAKDFMGHSKDMSYVYDHTNPAKIKEMLKSQVYNLEDLPEQNKHELIAFIEQREKEYAEKFAKLKKEVEALKAKFKS